MIGAGRGEPGLNFVGMLLLAALGTFVWNATPPLESARPMESSPGDPDTQGSGPRQKARLWQDPFSILPPHSKLTPTPQASPLPAIIGVPPTDSQPLTILGVMVAPGERAELHERRRRRRYAVLSALSEAGFAPRDPDVLSVAHLSSSMCSDIPGMQSCESMDVPYEWYDLESTAKKFSNSPRTALVLWLNDSKFQDHPFQAISQIVRYILHPLDRKARAATNMVLLGPARSGTLLTMVKQPMHDTAEQRAVAYLREQSNLRAFTILSPVATIADCDLLGQAGYKDTACEGTPKAEDAPETRLARAFDELFSIQPNSPEASSINRTPLHFVRTIYSDRRLILALSHELSANRFIENRRDTALVLSEWDTHFGRALLREFKSQYATRKDMNSPEGPPSSQDAQPSDKKLVLAYPYLRGIDGFISGNEEQHRQLRFQKTDLTRQSPPSSFILTSPANVRRPVGAGQFDYLRRLAVVIRKSNRERRLEHGHGIRVAAIFGNDVYDKLLILHAFRGELTNALWLTTDLDANLLHPAEFKWTRNLIIASTYGLQLNRRLQSQTPPFRDSYQTSVFLATSLAVDPTKRAEVWPNLRSWSGTSETLQNEFYQKIGVHLFEVGRQGAVPISRMSASHLNATTRDSFFSTIAVSVFLLAALSIAALCIIRPYSGRLLMFLSGLLAAFVGLTFFAWFTSAEPLTLTAGVSIWPTEYLRVLAMFLTVGFMWIIIHRLKANWHTLNMHYLGGPPTDAIELLTPKDIYRRLRTWRPKPEPWVVLVALLFPIAALAMVGPHLLFQTLSLGERVFLQSAIWLVLFSVWTVITRGHPWESTRVAGISKWIEKQIKEENNQDLAQTWRGYGAVGATKHRFLRSAAYTLLYLAFAGIVFTVLGSGSSPCRGMSCHVDRAIVIASVLPMLFLLFFVADAIRLCSGWIYLVRRSGMRWPIHRVKAFAQRHKLSEADASAWMTVHIIGDRTAEVGRAVYYPVIVILLLLVARSTYFDDWAFPQAMAIVVGINFAIAAGSAVYLSYLARATRTEILEKLDKEEMRAAIIDANAGNPIKNPRPPHDLIKELEALKIGSYQRFFEQPIVRAILLVGGGFGLTYIQYLPPF